MRDLFRAAVVVAAVAVSTACFAQSPGSAVGLDQAPAGSPGRGGNVGGMSPSMAQPARMKRMRRMRRMRRMPMAAPRQPAGSPGRGGNIGAGTNR